MLQVAQRALYEVRRPVQAAIQCDSLRPQSRLEPRERTLDGERRAEGVGAVLTGEGNQHTRFPHDECIAGAEGRSLLNCSDIPQMDGGAVTDGDQCVAQPVDIRLWNRRLQKYALRVQIDKSGSPDG